MLVNHVKRERSKFIREQASHQFIKVEGLIEQQRRLNKDLLDEVANKIILTL